MLSSSLLTVTPASRRWVSDGNADKILLYIHYASPIILLFFFLAAFTAHSILTASEETTAKVSTDKTGPGGKPLPSNTGARAAARRKKQVLDFSPARKLLFQWTSVGALLTFVANGVVVILHTVLNRKDEWWCGEAVAVRDCKSTVFKGSF
ncbi:MAG: hypothetical protein Q9187_008558 [Circinaria calcarea]